MGIFARKTNVSIDLKCHSEAMARVVSQTRYIAWNPPGMPQNISLGFTPVKCNSKAVASLRVCGVNDLCLQHLIQRLTGQRPAAE